jgi:hypothetical protein
MKDFRITERFGAHLNLLPAALYDAFPAVLFGRVLVLASRLGVFEALDRRSLTIDQLSPELKLPVVSTELILASLESKGYLRRRNGLYSLAPQARKWLVRSSPHYIGNFIRYIELLHARWMQLEQSLASGSPERGYIDTFTPAQWLIYTDGMMDLARLIMPRLLPLVTLPPTARSLLDIGGSHGLYSIELCKRFPGLRATVADLPPVLERTREIVREQGLSDRISFLPCNLTDSSFAPGRYDAALMFNIIHGFAPRENKALLARVASALNSGGRLFIMDQFKWEKSRGVDRLLPLMVGINLLNEAGGNSYDGREVSSWCREAGFGEVGLKRLVLPGVGLITARKI